MSRNLTTLSRHFGRVLCAVRSRRHPGFRWTITHPQGGFFMRLILTGLALMSLLPSSPASADRRTGAVRASHRALKDDGGEFHALGATMMWALWAYKND